MTSGLRPRPNATDTLCNLRAFSRTLIEKLIDFLFGPAPKPVPVKSRKRR